MGQETDLAAAIRAARGGQTAWACDEIRRLVRLDPDDARAWSWLAYLTDDDFERVQSLQRVLEIEPGREDVRAWLRRHTEIDESAKAVRGEPAAREAGPRLRDGHALVVEPDAGVRRLVGLILRRFGWSSEPAARATDALEAALGRRPDLVLLETRLPGQDGYELCRELRAAVEPAPWVVLVTGADGSFDLERARWAEADQLFRKPYSPTAMEEILRAAGADLVRSEVA